MFRRCTTRFATAADAELKRQRMTVLYEVVTGVTALKGKAAVKDCNIQAIYGSAWKADLGEYVASLKGQEKTEADAALNKFLPRLELTRYTTSELSAFMSGGAHSVAAFAQAQQVADAKAFAAEHGASALKSHIEAEAKNANWTDAQTAAFLKAAA